MEFDSENTKQELLEMLNGGIEEYGWRGDEVIQEIKDYYEECLSLVDYSEFEYTSFAYNNIPYKYMDSESVIFCEKPQIWLRIIFDGFDYICQKLKENN